VTDRFLADSRVFKCTFIVNFAQRISWSSVLQVTCFGNEEVAVYGLYPIKIQSLTLTLALDPL